MSLGGEVLAEPSGVEGLNPGAAFFGWLVAVAVSLLLTGIVGAIAAAVGTSTHVQQTADQTATGTIGLVAGIELEPIAGKPGARAFAAFKQAFADLQLVLDQLDRRFIALDPAFDLFDFLIALRPEDGHISVLSSGTAALDWLREHARQG